MAVQKVFLLNQNTPTVITGGFVPKGAYAAGTDYAVGDSVSYNGSSYVMYVDAAAGTLPTDTTKWQVVANIGATGATGPVDTANSPNANEFARFTDATHIEGRTAAEVKSDLDLEIGTDLQAWSSNLDEYSAVNPTAAGLALLDDANAAAQLVTLGITASAAELSYTDGVTSAIQTQLDLKALDSDVVHDTGTETIAGVKTFSSDPLIPDEAYGAGWDGALEPPTKNAVYDKIEALPSGHDAVTVTDSSEINFTLTGQDITAALINGSIDEARLDTSVNASLDLADSASQPGHTHVKTDLTDIADFLLESEVDADIKTLSLPASTTISTFGASLVDDADASAGRTTLGLVAGGTGDIWVEKAGDTMTGALSIGVAGNALSLKNSTDSASVQVAIFEGDRATPANNDNAYLSFNLSDSAGNQDEMIRMQWKATSVTSGAENGQMIFSVRTAGTLAEELSLSGTILRPIADDGLSLGSSGLAWSDLFLASGAVINFNAGDMAITHSTDKLAITGGIVGIGNGATSSSKLLTVTDHGSPNTSAGANGILVDITGGGGIYMTGGSVYGKYEAYSSELGIGTMSNHPIGIYHNNTKKITLDSTSISPSTSDAYALGKTSLMWSDLFLADGGVINWNNGDVSLTHSSNKLALSGGEFSFDSSLSGAYRGITALRTLDNTDYFIDCTANTFTVTLPTAVGITGRQCIIKNSGTGVITVDGNGSETIDGQTTWALPAQYDSITIMSDGANWKIIGKA